MLYVVLYRDKKNRRDKKGQNAQSTQNGCTSPRRNENEADVMPGVETPAAAAVSSSILCLRMPLRIAILTL